MALFRLSFCIYMQNSDSDAEINSPHSSHAIETPHLATLLVPQGLQRKFISYAEFFFATAIIFAFLDTLEADH